MAPHSPASHPATRVSRRSPFVSPQDATSPAPAAAPAPTPTASAAAADVMMTDTPAPSTATATPGAPAPAGVSAYPAGSPAVDCCVDCCVAVALLSCCCRVDVVLLLRCLSVLSHGVVSSLTAAAGEFNDPAWVASLLSQLGGVDMAYPATEVSTNTPSSSCHAVTHRAVQLLLTLPVVCHCCDCAAPRANERGCCGACRRRWMPSLAARRRTATAAAAEAAVALVTRSS